jgi:tryptophan 2,3-dioxygenase
MASFASLPRLLTGTMNMRTSMTYGGYLHLPELLGCQKPLSGRHDEMLFIILHQTMELWMKQVLFEIDAAQGAIARGELVPAYKNLARVSRIQAVMTQGWDILSTMTPADYLGFREVLGTSSGFQSAQFRILESRPHGRRSIAIPPGIGRSISLPKNFSISTTRC